MKKRVKIKAYIAGNLGDDLFIELLCSRYPEAQFDLCGSKKFSSLYKPISNLKYYSYDTHFVRMRMAIYRCLAKAVNFICSREVLSQMTTDVAQNRKYEKYADINVYITGSGFMNGVEERELSAQKRAEERRYYNLHPYLLGCNFGPYAHDAYLEMYQELFQDTSDLCFRDSYSLRLFPTVKTARVAADIVFCYPIEKVRSERVLLSENYLLISVANLAKDKDTASGYVEDYIQMLKRLVADRNNRHLHTVLLGFCKEQGDDLAISTVLDGIVCPELNHVYCYPDISKLQALRLFLDADFVLATRYHAMILALLFGKKVCPICYSEKVTHVLADISPDAKYVTLEDLKQLDISQLECEKTTQISEEQRKALIASANTQFRALDQVL